MNNMKRIIATLICTVLLCTLLAPVSALAATTYTFSKVVFGVGTEAFKVYTYPESSKKVRITVDGDDVSFSIPAGGEIPAAELSGRIDKNQTEKALKNLNVLTMFVVGGNIKDGFTVGKYYTDDRYDKIFKWSVDSKGNPYQVHIQFRVKNVKHPNDIAQSTGYFRISEPVPNAVVQKEKTKAETKAGEDSGVGILSSIFGTDDNKDNKDKKDTHTPRSEKRSAAETAALGLAGALTAAGALGAASGSAKKNGKEEEDERKRHKMYVYKTFGDGIQKGAPPVEVYARIAEIIGDKEYDCPKLTEQIRAYGQNLNVRTAGMKGEYITALVSADAASQDSEGTLTFSFVGPGGEFHREITFRLVGEPSIVFPRDTGDGYWDMSSDNSTVDMVAGEGGQDKLRFVFADAVEEPENIRFLDTDGFDIQPEKDVKLAFTYYACIRNKTDPIDKESGVFADKQERQIWIEAEFPGNLIVRGYFTIGLYPGGLSVLAGSGPNPLKSKTPGARKVLKNGWMEVISYVTKDKGELTLDPLIPSTYFNPCFAMVRPDGKAVVHIQARYFSFEQLRHTDEATNNILAKYHYDISWKVNGFSFSPEDSIPEMKSEYYVLLPMTAKVEGRSESVEIPVRLLGEPFDPMKGWNEEFKGLCQTVIRYFPGEVAHNYVQYIRDNFNDPQVWDRSQLRIMRFKVIRTAQDFWTAEYAKQMRFIQYYDMEEAIFKKPPRFIADMAFKIIAKYYWKDNDAWIVPLKDLFLDIMDEGLWSIAHTGSWDVDYLEKIREQATNTLENAISVKNPSASLSAGEQKKLLSLLMLYIMADFFKNYYKMSPKDFWECLRTTWFDMTEMALRKLAAAGFESALNSKTVNKFFNSKFAQKMNDYLPGKARGYFAKPGVFAKPGIEDTKFFEKAGNVDLSILRNDNVWKATHRPSGKVMFILLKDMSYVGYRDLVQKILEEFFGMGSVWLKENANETMKDDASWRLIEFPVKPSWLGLEEEEGCEELTAQIDAKKLFSSESGIASEALRFLFEWCFGPFGKFVHKLQSSPDPGREVLNLDENN